MKELQPARGFYALLHRIFKGHWPRYKYYGYDKYGFELYEPGCLECDKIKSRGEGA